MEKIKIIMANDENKKLIKYEGLLKNIELPAQYLTYLSDDEIRLASSIIALGGYVDNIAYTLLGGVKAQDSILNKLIEKKIIDVINGEIYLMLNWQREMYQREMTKHKIK